MFDLHTTVIDWEEMRDLQLAYFKSGVPHIDTPQDHAFFATMYQFADAHGIRDILTGANYSTEGIRNPIEWMYYQSDSTQLKDIHRRHGARAIVGRASGRLPRIHVPAKHHKLVAKVGAGDFRDRVPGHWVLFVELNAKIDGHFEFLALADHSHKTVIIFDG